MECVLGVMIAASITLDLDLNKHTTEVNASPVLVMSRFERVVAFSMFPYRSCDLLSPLFSLFILVR